jgi:hypothetical protein
MNKGHRLQRILFGRGTPLQISVFLSCLISIGSALLYSNDEAGLSSLLILVLWLGTGVLSWFLPKATKDDHVGLFWILLSSLLSSYLALHFKVPFENDLYRYFFEGKALLLGYNPYLISPEELSSAVPFSHFFSIGYPELSGVYPPLTVFIFSVLGKFSFRSGLIIFSLLNGVLLWTLVNRLLDEINPQLKRRGGVILILYLMREMIFQHHFELWPILFFILGLTFFKNKNQEEIGWVKAGLCFFVSFHIKLVAIIPLCFFSLRELVARRNLFSFVVIIGSLLSSFYFFYFVGFFNSDGLEAFSKNWYFSPGLLGWAWPLLKNFFSFSTSKLISLLCGSLYIIFMFYRRKKMLLYLFDDGIALLMITFFYISPVYNAWYALWPAILMFRVQKISLGLWCLILSPLCYTYFVVGGESWAILTVSHLIIHGPILIFLIYSFCDGTHLDSNHKRAIQFPTLWG